MKCGISKKKKQLKQAKILFQLLISKEGENLIDRMGNRYLWFKLTDNGMVCLACQAHADKTVINQFISGCISYKSEGEDKALFIYNANIVQNSMCDSTKMYCYG